MRKLWGPKIERTQCTGMKSKGVGVRCTYRADIGKDTCVFHSPEFIEATRKRSAALMLNRERLPSGQWGGWKKKVNKDIQYIRDSDVDAALDLEIRNLLCECFGEGLFRTQRYATEMPAHRWLLRSDDGKLIGHVAAHEKEIVMDGLGSHRIIGLAEACIHPDYRRGGRLRRMLSTVTEWALAENRFAYCVLFGFLPIYASSGYKPVTNLWDETWTEFYSEVLALSLSGAPWPSRRCALTGPRF